MVYCNPPFNHKREEKKEHQPIKIGKVYGIVVPKVFFSPFILYDYNFG